MKWQNRQFWDCKPKKILNVYPETEVEFSADGNEHTSGDKDSNSLTNNHSIDYWVTVGSFKPTNIG